MWLFSLLTASFIIWRGIFQTNFKRIIKILLSAITLIIAFKFHLLAFIGGGNFFSPELPKGIIVTSTYVFTIFFIFLLGLIVAEVCRAFLYLFNKILKHKHNFETYKILQNKINLIILVIAIIFSTYGLIAGSALPNIKNQSVAIKNLPEDANELKIAVLADLHINKLTDENWATQIVEKTNAENPDLIVIVGDFVDGNVKDIGTKLIPLKNLHAKYGVFGVPGNHEYYSGYDAWIKFLPTLGINMLINNSVEILPNLALIGVTDLNAKHFSKEEPNFEKALKNTHPNAIKILLAHQPKLSTTAKKYSINLQISGHTHGGIIFGFDRIVAAANNGFVSGLYYQNTPQIYVSNGTGIWSGFPVRIFCPSEITILTLKKEQP